MGTMRRLWPVPTTMNEADLDEAAVTEAYAPDPARPVRVNFVTSLDGAVTLDGRSEGLSGDADRLVFKLLRMHCDALLVGAGTLRNERYRAVRLDADRRAWRVARGHPEYPVLVVVSGSLDLDPAQAAFADAPVRPVVFTHAASPAERRTAIAGVADVMVCGESVVDLAVGLAELRARGLTTVLCEGGPHLFGTLLAAGLVDELCLTISPLLVGPGPDRIVDGPTGHPPQGMALRHLIAADDVLLTRYSRS